MKSRFTLPLCCMGFAVLGCGTGSDLDLVDVEGIVTLDGEPLSHGTVQFVPDGPTAVGVIGEDGRFTLETAGEPGAVVGQHQVRVECRQILTDEQAARTTLPPSLIPARYGNPRTSPLSVAISHETQDVIELKLTSQE